MSTKNTTAANETMFKRMTIGDRLRWLMEVREIKQVELAAQVGITQAAISNLVTDSSRKPSAPSLLRIAMVLKCNPMWVLTGEGDPYAWAPVTSAQEVELLNLFHALGVDSKAALIAVARSMKPKA